MGERDDVSVTFVYKIGCNCEGCTRKVKKVVRDFDGVEVVKTDCGAIKVTVKGTNVDQTAIREKLEKEFKRKKVEQVSPRAKKEGGGGGGDGGGDKKSEKRAGKKKKPKNPKEKEGEKNGGDNKVALAEKKDDVWVTAFYKIDYYCEGFAKKVKKAVLDFDGVEKAKIVRGAIKVTINWTKVDPMAIREKLEEKFEEKFKMKKVELVYPQPRKEGGGSGGEKKPTEKKARNEEETKKPKEKEGEKNGGDNKVAPAEKKDDVWVTAFYKIDYHYEGFAKKVKKAVLDFDGVEKVKIDRGAIKVTVKVTKVDPKKPKEKEGEKNGGDNKVAPAEKKDDFWVTAVYKIDYHCEGFAKKVKKAVLDFDGVEEVKIDLGAIKVTVKGTKVDPMADLSDLFDHIKL